MGSFVDLATYNCTDTLIIFKAIAELPSIGVILKCLQIVRFNCETNRKPEKQIKWFLLNDATNILVHVQQNTRYN